MRKTKPIEEIQKLTPTQLAQLHTWFEQGLGYHDCMAKFQSEFGASIKYHKIYKYYHLWQHATELSKHSGQTVALLEIIAVLQGEAAPFSELTHHLLQKAACAMAANPENTTMDLVRLMRLANNPLQQEVARHRMHIQDEKIALQKRALEIRAEKEKRVGESHKTSEQKAIEQSNHVKEVFKQHPVFKGIVAEPKSYEETAKENDHLYRTGTNTSPFRVVGPIDSNLNPNLNRNLNPGLSPTGTPLKPHQSFAHTWEPTITEHEKSIAVLPIGIDHSIKPNDPTTWPKYYHRIQKLGNIALLEFLCQNQLRTVTPWCFPSAKLIGAQGHTHFGNGDYLFQLGKWNIPYYLRHPVTNRYLHPRHGCDDEPRFYRTPTGGGPKVSNQT